MGKNTRKKEILKEIMKYSVPSIIAMILSSMVTIVDGLFISNILGKDILAAINIGMPMLYVFLAIGIMIGVGGVSLAGRRLGQKNFKDSNNVFKQTIFTAVISLYILSLIFRIGLDFGLKTLGIATNSCETIINYYGILLWIYPVMMMNIIMGMFLRCEKKHHILMLNTVVITVTNILLDYYLIAKINMGVLGAATASAFAIIIGMILMISNFLNDKSIFTFGKFTFDKKDLKNTVLNGSSEFIGQISMSITMFFLNLVVMNRLGMVGVAAISIIGYTAYIFNMIVVGFGQGISPLISYNYGSNNLKVCNDLRKETSKIVIISGLFFCILLLMFASSYGNLFTDSKELLELISFGLPVFSISFITSGYNVITSFYFTGIGFAKESALISSLRSLLLLLLNIFLLPIMFGDLGIWLIAPVTETITFLVTVILIKKSMKDALGSAIRL
jgi:putative MATE family efflux protein